MVHDFATTRCGGWDFELQRAWAARLVDYWDRIEQGEEPTPEWIKEAQDVARVATYPQVRAIARYVATLA
jgi:hypothetical protein